MPNTCTKKCGADGGCDPKDCSCAHCHNYRCETCRDHHHVCSFTGKAPCQHTNVPSEHDWIPCHVCSVDRASVAPAGSKNDGKPLERTEPYSEKKLAIEDPQCWYGTFGHGHYCQCGRNLVHYYAKLWGTAEECRHMMFERWGKKWCTTYDGGSGEYTQRPAWLDEYNMALIPQACWDGDCKPL